MSETVEGPSGLAAVARRDAVALVFSTGAVIGVLGGLIGLGGAEFRLPLLIGLFGFAALHAVILNKAMSLIVVLTALPARLIALPYPEVSQHWTIAANLLAGSLIGAWLGAGWATRMRSRTLYRVLALLLMLIAGALATSHLGHVGTLELPTAARICTAVAAGVGIGIVAALMGVAGGELLIPTIVLLFGVDIKVAGSLSLMVSLPTMLVAFARYSRDQSFQILRGNTRFVLVMAAGSIAGTVVGGLLLGVVPSAALIPLLTALLLVSAVKVWRHQ
ncbi:sulfite exporter TauE/SafE family protein [Nocardia salmonicida]|uniref:sulfite exporter TauE/SafE family protein n=1 Tax=Nocardia salmonicida TaxID=53431 RepID=UPI0033F8BA8E